ncbi:MAG: efflux RND transporter permease subunit, partial [Pseudomonadota bacterium]
MDLRDAIVTASQKRLTPIMLTSLTTVFGLMPMAIAGGALFEPMAALMIGGLAVASILTLFFVPCGYYLFFKTYRMPWNREKSVESTASELENEAVA